MTILAIDPGPIDSAYVVLRDGEPIKFGKVDNEWLLARLTCRHGADGLCGTFGDVTHLAIEMVASYGMPVGAEIFETVLWTGRFVQAFAGPHTLVYRREVKSHLCNSAKAKDSNVRQSLIDKYGGKAKAIGSRMARGPLFGVTADVWSALAIAITYAETRERKAA